MPYFISSRDGKHCVIKGTQEKPGEVEKCYTGEDAEEKARDLMKALHANVEDVKNVEKAESINSRLDKIRNAFYAQHQVDNFASPVSSTDLWVRETFDTYVIVEESGITYRVSYSMFNDEASFAPRAEWTKVESQWVESKFLSYKAANDIWRWTSISSVAIKDKEKEIVSEAAYDDAIKHALESNQFGELDVVHIDGTEVGDCDMMARLGFQLIESGTWRNTDKARMVRSHISEDPDNWGVSIQFHFDPKQFDGITYKGGIQITKRAVLPRSMSASYGTAIAIQGGTEMKGKMTEEAKAVLLDLGWTEGDLVTLAEKNVEDGDLNPNVKNKDEDVEKVEKVEEKTESTLRSRAWSAFTNLFGEPQATQSDVVENETEDPTKTSVEIEEIKTEEKVDDKTDDKVEDSEALKNTMTALFTSMAEETSKAIQASIAPLHAHIVTLEARILESEKSVEEKVLTRLASLPPVVKVQPTSLAPITNIPVQGEVVAGNESQAKVFVDSVVDLIGKGFASGGSLPKFDL